MSIHDEVAAQIEIENIEQSLRNQIAALTKDRDEWQQSADALKRRAERLDPVLVGFDCLLNHSDEFNELSERVGSLERRKVGEGEVEELIESALRYSEFVEESDLKRLIAESDVIDDMSSRLDALDDKLATVKLDDKGFTERETILIGMIEGVSKDVAALRSEIAPITRVLAALADLAKT